MIYEVTTKWQIVTIRINNCKQVGSDITNQITPDSQKDLTFNFATNPEKYNMY